MPRVHPAHGALGGVDDHVEHRRHLALLGLGPEQPVEALHHASRVVALERVRPQRAPQPSDHRRPREPLARDVAHHEPHGAARDRDHVVPVAAHLGLRGGREIARRDLEAREVRQAVGQQAALKRLGDPVLALVHARVRDREAHALRGEPQNGEVLPAELPRRLAAGHEHSRHVALRQQRHADQRVLAARAWPRATRPRCEANSSLPVWPAGADAPGVSSPFSSDR